MSKKPKAYDDWENEPSYIIGCGSYQRIGEPSKTKMKQIGFVRQKPDKVKERPRNPVAKRR